MHTVGGIEGDLSRDIDSSTNAAHTHMLNKPYSQFLMLYQLSGGDGGVGAKAAAESAADGSVTSRPFNYSCIKPHCGNV